MFSAQKNSLKACLNYAIFIFARLLTHLEAKPNQKHPQWFIERITVGSISLFTHVFKLDRIRGALIYLIATTTKISVNELFENER